MLADRSLTVRRQVTAAYPRLKKKRVTYSGSGYGDGYREGQKADIGGGEAPVAFGWGARPLTRRDWASGPGGLRPGGADPSRRPRSQLMSNGPCLRLPG